MLDAVWYFRDTTTSNQSHQWNSRVADPVVLVRDVSGGTTSTPRTSRGQTAGRPADTKWTPGRQLPKDSATLSGGRPCTRQWPVFPCGRYLRWVHRECIGRRRPWPDIVAR